ncbi:biotin/lipoyl-containing protein [Streptomyces sp. CC216C]|uniref:biotin/lipoyl-containing protein n=1 Tax=Streptomyces sp. CC216C TaxID=3044576 RepID=UPI0024A951BB|nr:biotin/lipoyl-containing protein [Streptomyces sp. CC216C]
MTTMTETSARFREFKMPDVGEGLTEAEILKWFVQPGDTVTDGQVVCEVETAKAAVELPIPFDGVVHELRFPEGTTVDVGQVIIAIDVAPGSGDAPAPARQWPLLTVLCAAGLGLLIVVLDPFDQAFRVGTILIGGALIAGAVLRWVVPSVGMLAVRSRFTDLVTYGVMGTLIVLLALVAQPDPWLDVPILEDAVRFTIR